MVNAIGEEQAFCIDREFLKIRAFAVPVIVLEDGFDGVADPEVILAVLVS